MNYEPKFGYVAWKNNREVESHAGFKGVAFKYGEFLIYYCLHAQTSKLRRVSERHHSIILVVVDARTKELLVELQHKAFYGALMTRKKGGGFIALSTEEERIVRQLEEDNHSRNKRSVNVIDVKNLHPAYEYNMPLSSIIHGRYEEWTTGPICTARGHRGMITVDFRNPITGIKSARQRTVPVNLGSYYGDTFLRHDGSARRFVMREFELSEDDCVFKLKNILGGMSIDGSFYTDAYGVNIVATSGTIHVKQYMKRGFKMKVDGHFEPVDVWNGLFEKDAGNRRSSYGFGLDPEVN